jgi:hypothetical protein
MSELGSFLKMYRLQKESMDYLVFLHKKLLFFNQNFAH